MIIDYECEWSILILLLYEYNIIFEVEKYAKKKKILKQNEKITDIEYKILCKCVKLFLNETNFNLEKSKKNELLSFCLL